MDGDAVVAAVSIECSDGTAMMTYDDRFWTVDGEIFEGGSDSPEYAAAYDACLG